MSDKVTAIVFKKSIDIVVFFILYNKKNMVEWASNLTPLFCFLFRKNFYVIFCLKNVK